MIGDDEDLIIIYNYNYNLIVLTIKIIYNQRHVIHKNERVFSVMFQR